MRDEHVVGTARLIRLMAFNAGFNASMQLSKSSTVDLQSAESITMTKHQGTKQKTKLATNAIVSAWHNLLTSNERLVTSLRLPRIVIAMRRC